MPNYRSAKTTTARSLFFVFCAGLSPAILCGQNAGISFDGSAPNVSAAFDINVAALAGQKKGLLIPRITEGQRTAMNPLPAAAQGLLVYQTNNVQGFYYNTSSTTTPSWAMLVNSDELRWDLLKDPAGDLVLAHGANRTFFTFDGFTSPSAFSISSNSITKGTLMEVSSNSVNGADGVMSEMVSIYRAGANANPNHAATGIRSIVNNTGTNSTNYGGYFSAANGTTNYALYAETTNGTGVGLFALNSSTTPGAQIAVFADKAGNTPSGNGFGIRARANGTGISNYGGFFSAAGANENYGVWAETDADQGRAVYAENTSTGAGTQVGVTGIKSGATGTGTGVGVSGIAYGTGSNNYGGYFWGYGALTNYGAYGFINSGLGYGLYGYNASPAAGDQYGVYGTKLGFTGTGNGYGVYGAANGSGAKHYGGYFFANGATENYGVYGYVPNNGVGVHAESYGGTGLHAIKNGNMGYLFGNAYAVRAEASGTATTNNAGYFTATNATNNIAVYGQSFGAATTNTAATFAATGATNNFAIMVPANGGHVALGTSTVSTNSILTMKDGHVQSQQTTAPTIGVGAAAPLGTPLLNLGSTDVAGNFTINPGAGAVAGAQFSLTFNKVYSSIPRVIITPTNLAASTKDFYVGTNTFGFILYFAAAPAAGNNSFNYIVIEN